MRWMREHKLITALLLVFLLLLLIFAASMAAGGRFAHVTEPINTGVSKVSGIFSKAGNTIRDNVKGIFSYRSLQKEVEALKSENAELTRQLAEEKLTKQQLDELKELAEALNYDYTEQKFDIVTGDVISLDGSHWTNIFTINCGTESGIKVGDAVVNGIGLIGKVEETGEGWSKVMSLIDEGSKVSFKLARDRKQLGVVSGNEKGEVSGYMIDGEALVSEGDVIITSGLGTYPEGLEIGSVKSVTYNSNTLLKEITVELAVNFKSLDKVAVILLKVGRQGFFF